MGEIKMRTKFWLERLRVGKVEGKKLLGRLRCIWKDNIKLDPREIYLETLNSINLAQDRDRRLALVNMVTNFIVPKMADNFLII
jgi:hypothetical protein